MDVAWRQSRYDKDGPGRRRGRTTSTARWTRRSTRPSSTPCWPADKAEFKDWEHVPYFDGCLPIEVMAERGRETLRHGPMKPVGLTNPHNPDGQGPTPSSSCARTMRWARCGTWSASRPS